MSCIRYFSQATQLTYNSYCATLEFNHSLLDKNVYRTAKENDRNDLTMETIEKFCSSAAKLRLCSIVSIVKSFLSFFLAVRCTIFLSSTEEKSLETCLE